MPLRLVLVLMLLVAPPLVRAAVAHGPAGGETVTMDAFDAHGHHGQPATGGNHAGHGPACLLGHCLVMAVPCATAVPRSELLPPAPPSATAGAPQWIPALPCDPPSSRYALPGRV